MSPNRAQFSLTGAEDPFGAPLSGCSFDEVIPFIFSSDEVFLNPFAEGLITGDEAE